MRETHEDDLGRLHDLIAGWPGLTGRPDRALVDDCLVLLPFLAGALRVVDVGSGGGLPGLALKLARPELELTMIESSGRKAAFLTHACARLGVRAEVVRARAEEVGRDPKHRETYDAAVARAVASLPVLAELCLPLVRPGGTFLAMKTAGADELAAAQPAFEMLGGRLVTRTATPSRLRERGEVVVVTKVAATPGRYPRRPGIPGRRPLGA